MREFERVILSAAKNPVAITATFGILGCDHDDNKDVM
jgi:hypothetical protein